MYPHALFIHCWSILVEVSQSCLNSFGTYQFTYVNMHMRHLLNHRLLQNNYCSIVYYIVYPYYKQQECTIFSTQGEFHYSEVNFVPLNLRNYKVFTLNPARLVPTKKNK